MIQPEPEDLPKDNPKLEIAVLRRSQELIRETSTPSSGSKDLVFLTRYPQPFLIQCKACLWKQHWCYWRNLNAIRFAITVLTAAILGVFSSERVKDSKARRLLKQVVRLDARLHRLNMAILSLLVIIWKLLRVGFGESAGVDSSIFTKTCVDSAGSEGLKDHSAIDRWQSQAAAANFDFFNRELVGSQPLGVDNIKQSVDYVASLLMPLYKARKIDKVMEQTTVAEKAMAVFEFLDFKRKNKPRLLVSYFLKEWQSKHVYVKMG
ncbi:hypothetical protein Tco_1457137 [Tanacetum coccineum]